MDVYDHSIPHTTGYYKKEFYGSSHKMLAKIFEPRSHKYRETLRTTKPTQVKFYIFKCVWYYLKVLTLYGVKLEIKS